MKIKDKKIFNWGYQMKIGTKYELHGPAFRVIGNNRIVETGGLIRINGRKRCAVINLSTPNDEQIDCVLGGHKDLMNVPVMYLFHASAEWTFSELHDTWPITRVIFFDGKNYCTVLQ